MKKRFGATIRLKSFKILVLVICLMPVGFASPSTLAAQKVAARKIAVGYVCPMDADVKSATPGKCPKCGMALEKADASVVPVEPAAEGEIRAPQIPDVPVLDQNGRKLRFYSDLVKGKTVAINFIFTTCATICPPLTATFRKVQQETAERAGRDVSFISISVDPATDSPDRLKEFSDKFKVGPGWAFVTGSKPDIDHLLRALGAYVGDKVNHTPMVLIGNDQSGHWTRAYGLAPAATLVKAISEAHGKDNSLQVPMPGAHGTERQVERRAPARETTPVSQPARRERPGR